MCVAVCVFVCVCARVHTLSGRRLKARHIKDEKTKFPFISAVTF